jgi:hypothetical protein
VDKLNDDVLVALSAGPSRKVRTWKRYYVNGFNFRVLDEKKEVERRSQNNGVCVASSDENDYYGTLKEVIELRYSGQSRSYTTTLFKCDWIDNDKRGTRVHNLYKIVEVNRSKKYRIYDPFVLAYQADQVYYTSFPNTKKDTSQWSAVFKTKARSHIIAPVEENVYQEENIAHISEVTLQEHQNDDFGQDHMLEMNSGIEIVEEGDGENEQDDDMETQDEVEGDEVQEDEVQEDGDPIGELFPDDDIINYSEINHDSSSDSD